MERIKYFFAPPVFENDEEKTRLASLLNAILYFLIIVRIILVIRSSSSSLLTGLTQLNNGAALALLVVSLILIRWGQVRWSAFLLLANLLISTSLPFLTIGGLNSPYFLGALLFILSVAALLLGGWGTIIFSGLIILIVISMNVADTIGLITKPTAETNASGLLFGYSLITIVVGFMLWLTTRNLGQSLRRARENEKNAIESNRELIAIRRDLEVRVAERTRDLTLSAEIGRSVTQERDLARLLPNAVERIRETFALYYAQIYLTDLAERTLILRAGSGAVGQELLQRGHRLPVAAGSINGSAAYTKKSVLVEDTTKSTSFLPNPLLPKTRSEMAVPLLSGTRVLGVLNMQSEYPETFTQETLPAYEILAGQLAAAIENAYQFAEIEQARAQVEAQSRLLTREGWDIYLDAVRQPEYIGVAYQNGDVENLATATPLTGNQLAIPISVAGAEIGSIQLDTEGRPLSPNDQELVTRLALLAGQHMENLRLLAEAEHYRRDAEISNRRLTREGWQAFQQASGEKASGFVYAQNRVKPLKVGADEPREANYIQPLTIRGEAIGKLTLALPEEADGLDADTTELISVVAETLTTHLENLRLTQATETALVEIEQRAHEFEALNRIIVGSSASLNLEETLPIMLREAVHLLKARSGGVAQLDSSKNYLRLIADYDIEADGPVAVGTMIPVANNFPTLQAIETKRAVVVPDAKNNPLVAVIRDLMIARNTECLLVVPLVSRGEVIGTIGLDASEPGREFTHSEVQLIETIAGQLAGLLENIRLFDETQRRAERETLINTINQRIQGATSMESALETAAREIGHLLKARQTIVEIGITPPNGQ